MIPAPLRALPIGITDAGYKTAGGACSRKRVACIAKLVPAADTPKVFTRRGGQAEQAAYS
jgi:hypothetical protein